MNLDRYHIQHSEIHHQLEELRRCPEAGPAAYDAAAARLSLVTLAAKLNIHLAFEDQALYPPLLKHPNQAVQAKTREYLVEVGGLKAALTGHMLRWLSTQRVLDDAQRFHRETMDLLQALERRLRGEDLDFYPLLERLA